MRASTLVLRSFLLGVAAGGRSMSGLAAVALTTRPGAVPVGRGPASGPLDSFSGRLDGLSGRLSGVSGRLGGISGRLVGDSGKRLGGISGRLGEVSARVGADVRRTVPGPVALSGAVAKLAGPRGRGVVVTAAIVELVTDKLPFAPSRLVPTALIGRMGLAALAAGALAVRERANPAWFLLPAAAGALAGSVAGARWRAVAEEHGWPPVAAALAEDAVVISLAAAAAAPRAR